MRIPKFSKLDTAEILELCRQTSRDVNLVVIHCSATHEGQDFDAKDIDSWHRQRGWSEIGYNALIKLDGTIEKGRNFNRIPSHTKGKNRNSLGVCYVGGVDKDMNPKDTRTPEQLKSMKKLVRALNYGFQKKGVELRFAGHNEFSSKACPSFRVPEYIEKVL